MKILVTGGSGFIGSNFILDQILNEKNKIFNFDKLSYAGNANNLITIESSPNYNFFRGDICDFRAINSIFNDFSPDTVVHFAAESHVDRSIDGPMDFINTNIVGTATLLEAAKIYYDKEKNTKFKFLHISTDEVFGSLKKGLFSENTPYSPNSPYSASKAASDHLVNAWYHTYGLPIIITNCSNNYGPYQFPEKLIPLIIANCVDEKPLPIYGNGQNIRDWLYVEDHCNAIKTILYKGTIGDKYNIGGNNEIQNIDIVKTICKNFDKVKPRRNGKPYEDLIKYVPDRPGHDFRYAINSTKINKNLGWKPNEQFKTGIRKTIKWYLDNENWWRKIQNEAYDQERLGLIN